MSWACRLSERRVHVRRGRLLLLLERRAGSQGGRLSVSAPPSVTHPQNGGVCRESRGEPFLGSGDQKSEVTVKPELAPSEVPRSVIVLTSTVSRPVPSLQGLPAVPGDPTAHGYVDTICVRHPRLCVSVRPHFGVLTRSSVI